MPQPKPQTLKLKFCRNWATPCLQLKFFFFGNPINTWKVVLKSWTDRVRECKHPMAAIWSFELDASSSADTRHSIKWSVSMILFRMSSSLAASDAKTRNAARFISLAWNIKTILLNGWKFQRIYNSVWHGTFFAGYFNFNQSKNVNIRMLKWQCRIECQFYEKLKNLNQFQFIIGGSSLNRTMKRFAHQVNIYLYYMPILTTISLRHLVLGHSTGRCLLTTDTATIRYRRERRFRRWRIWRIIVTFRRRMRVASIRRKCCCRSAHSDCLAIPTCRSEIQKNWIVRQKNWWYFSTDPYVVCL